MSKKERKNTLELIIWINLLLGVYNLYGFVNTHSYFNLIVGSLNIAVWVFHRDKLSPLSTFWSINKMQHKRK